MYLYIVQYDLRYIYLIYMSQKIKIIIWNIPEDKSGSSATLTSPISTLTGFFSITINGDGNSTFTTLDNQQGSTQ